MGTVLIFGVTGQLGSYLAELFLANKYRVVGVARRVSTDSTQRLVWTIGYKGFELVEGDITDCSSLLRIFLKYQPNVVVNCCAQSHVATSFEEPLHTWNVTAQGCLNILEMIRSLHFHSKFIQLSSSEMFGDQIDPDGFQRETTLMRPRSPYSIAKLAAHQAVQLYRDSYGVWAASAICFNMESERRQRKFVTRKISSYVGYLYRTWQSGDFAYIAGEKVPDRYKLRLGNLNARRDWSYCPDTANGILDMVLQDEPDDFVFGTGETYSVRDFCKEAFSHVGIEDWERFVTVDNSLLRPAEVPILRADASKAKQKLGWSPKHSFKDLVKLMVSADIENPARY